MSHRELVQFLRKIDPWDKKTAVYEHFKCDPQRGRWLDWRGGPPPAASMPSLVPHQGKINYGCGDVLLQGWLNADIISIDDPRYVRINLLESHPFESSSVRLAFTEDMIEHLTQAQSIFLLSEIYRALIPNGVARLSFPCLEGVLRKHYTPSTAEGVMRGEIEAYEIWDHIHFYSMEELRLVASHLGFREIKFVEFGISDHEELQGLETRDRQIGLNLYAELTK